MVDVTLESEASVIVMSCVHCKTPLMYYYGEAFEVDSIEMGDLQQKQLKAVQGYMKVHGVHPTQSRSAMRPAPSAYHNPGEPVREAAIDKDDILDLLIDLETTQDVDDFLKRLG